MNESRQLLAEYVEGSEAAFRELVVRYLDLVYSTALRLVNGDSYAAQDVSQVVFLDLARAARSMSGEAQLGGWLHRHTVFVAAKMMRAERRRRAREKQALDMNTPESDWSETRQVLDEAIDHLGATDRTAIVLRFFEGCDFRAVGEALGSNEDAAQKRVSRALGKLNRLLGKRGVKISAAALAKGLTTQAVSAAPAGMAATIGANVVLAAPHSASAFSLIKIMTFSKTQAACLAAVVLVASIAPSKLKRDGVTDLNKLVDGRTTELLAMERKNQGLASQLAKLDQQAVSDRDEVQKLRTEAAHLKAQEEKVKTLRQEIYRLGLRREGEKTYWQNREGSHNRQRITEAWLKAIIAYASKHDGLLPQSFAEAESYFPTNAVRAKLNPDEHYELLYRGSLNTLTNIDSNLRLALFRERKLHPLLHNYGGTNYDKMGRYTALASGETTWASVPHGFTDQEFSSYEEEISIPSSANEK